MDLQHKGTDITIGRSPVNGSIVIGHKIVRTHVPV